VFTTKLNQNNDNKEVQTYTTSSKGDFDHLLDNKFGDEINYDIVIEKDGYLPKTLTYTTRLEKGAVHSINDDDAFDFSLVKIAEDVDLGIALNPILWDLNVVDYLLKPLTLSKISEALNKIKKRGPKDLEEIYMKTGSGIKRMRFSEIKYIEATGDYVRIYLLNEKITISGTLKNVELSLPRNQFVRVHKSYLVNLDFVDRITSFSINPSKENIPIGRKYKPMLNEKLNLL
jgi:hypothetical protein